MTEFTSVVSKRLRVLMAEEGMTTKQLAKRAGLSVYSVRKYLSGDMAPTLETASKLAEALNCTPNDICAFSVKCSA